MADEKPSQHHDAGADDPSVTARPARGMALIGAWLSGLALVAIIASVVVLQNETNRPPDPTTTSLTINGHEIKGDRVETALKDAGSRLLEVVTGQGEEVGKEENLHITVQTTESESGEAVWKPLLWTGVGLAAGGSLVAVIARRRGARGYLVYIGLWPIVILLGLAHALPTCSM